MSFKRRRDASAVAKAIHQLSEKSRSPRERPIGGWESEWASLAVGQPAYPTLDLDHGRRVTSPQVANPRGFRGDRP